MRDLLFGCLFLPCLISTHELVSGQVPESPLRRVAWESMQVDRESSILLRDSNDGPVLARLAFPAAKILKVTAADGHVEFDVLSDVRLSEDGCTLHFENERGIEVVDSSTLYPPKGSPNSYAHRKDHPDQNLFYAPGRWFHDHNVEITYVRRELPQADPASLSIALGSLKRSLHRLRTDRALRIGVSGDSISTGLDASGTTKTPPNQPGYVELVREALTTEFGAKVEVENRSVPGWSIANGIEDWPKLRESSPDLVLIAYGMNDVGRRDPDWFEARLQELIGMIHRDLPNADIILVSPMLGNAEWIHTPREMFFEYRERMRSLVDDGVAMSDVTEVWQRMLQRKHDLDLTGNGLNHPNDFGHRLYAQAILQLFPLGD